MSEMPDGWITTTIGETCSIVSGSTPKSTETSYWNGDVPWITPDDLSRHKDKTIFVGRRSISHAGFASCSARMVPVGTVLFTSRAPIGYVAIAAQAVCTNQGFKSLVPPNGISSDYLYWYMRYATDLVKSRASGTTFAEISGKAMATVPLLIAPRREQERIVAAIEEQFSRLDAGVAALERAQQNLKRLRAAVLQAAVTGQLVPYSDEDVAGILDRISAERRAAWQAATNKPYREPAKPTTFPLLIPGHWRIASLEAITDPIRVICYGILMPKEHIKDGVPYVRVKDMKGWTIEVAGLKRTSPEIAAKYARASLKVGDLLLRFAALTAGLP